MSEIDWSKAPEGCTHYVVGSVAPFEKRAGDDWFFWSRRGCFWEKLHIYSGNDRIERSGLKIVERPSQSPAWSGEGLPPVGTVCEISFDGGPLGKALITYRAGNLLCWKWEAQKGEDECCSYVHRLAFKPIRTPEQIAADEREADIRAIVYDLQDAENLSSLPSIANCLYGKGYRKP